MGNDQILEDIETLDYDELEERYGIIIDDELGAVFDVTERRDFDTLREWAYFIISLEDDDNFAHASRIGGKRKFDDGGY